MVDDRDPTSDQRSLSRALTAPVRVVSKILGTGQAPETPPPTGKFSTSIIACALYVDGKRQDGEWHYADALTAARKKGGGFVWLGLHEPSENELDEIAATFDLHELPVEDAITSYQRPKVEQ